MAIAKSPRTHRPIWSRQLCLACSTCLRRCPASVFPEQAEEQDSLRGKLARQLGFPSQPPAATACRLACPLGQDVPGYLQAEAAGDFDQALRIILETNPLPCVCGRLCHQPCMRACLRRHVDEPVQIRMLKRAAVERTGKNPGMSPKAVHNRRVVVIGAGPSGLSTAYCLRRSGFEVEVLEEAEQPGGLLHQAVPSFDLPREALQADIERIRAAGVRIETNCPIRLPEKIPSLFEQGAQAVVLAVGAQKGCRLGVPGEQLEGCYDGVSFAKMHAQGTGPSLDGPSVVFGSGYLAAAVSRMALRTGAIPVTLILAASRRITSAEAEGIGLAEEEGVRVLVGMKPKELLGTGRLKAVRCETSQGHTELTASVFVAAKQRLSQQDWNNFTNPNQGIFVTGEAMTGPRNVVRAMATGMQVAYQVQKFLEGFS